MTTQQYDVTGEPRWDLAREAVARLRTLPAATAEANIRGQLFSILEFLFPGLPQSELTREKESGTGRLTSMPERSFSAREVGRSAQTTA